MLKIADVDENHDVTKPRRFLALSTAAVLLGSTLVAPGTASAQSVPTCGGLPATIVGTDGVDRIEGTEGRDVIVALRGADVIFGNGGDDIICGNAGADVIWGGNGADRILGGNGADRINGLAGNDFISGNSGDDELLGGSGNDEIFGGRNADTISGNLGADTLWGGRGLDRLLGGDGDDILNGGAHSDRLHGQAGSDTLNGGFNPDRSFGGQGNDFLASADDDLVVDGGVGINVINGKFGEHEFETAVADEVFRLVNCARTGSSTWCDSGDQDGWNVTGAERSGLSAFARDASLDSSSHRWSTQLQSNGRLVHDNFDWANGRSRAAENIVQGNFHDADGNVQHNPEFTPDSATSTALSVMTQWMDSTGHRRNILNPNLTDFGSGFESDGVRIWGTQRFAA